MLKMKVTTELDLTGLKKLRSRLKRQEGQSLEVGHFDGHRHLDSPEHSVAEISVINQFGMNKIPARPYMLPTMQGNFIKAEILKSSAKIAKGDSTVAKESRVLGMLIRDSMKALIEGKIMPANSAVTISLKGFDHPLIATEQLVDDINFRLTRDL